MTSAPSLSTPAIRLGVCPAHFKFADVLAPNENGKLPRHPDGQLKILTELKQFMTDFPIPLSVLPIFIFSGTREDDIRELLSGIKALGLTPEVILMINGANPMVPADEDQSVAIALGILNIAKSLNIDCVTSTTFEPWMDHTGISRTNCIDLLDSSHSALQAPNMPAPRLIIPHHSDGTLPDLACYHVTSRVVHRQFLFQDDEKEHFRLLMRMVERFSGCRVLSY